MKQMIHRVGTLCLGLAAFGVLALGFSGDASAKTAAAQSPKQLLQDTQAKMQALLDKKLDKKDKAALEAREVQIKKLLQPFFNYGLLAQRTLGNQWAKLKKEQQESFTFWLQALLEQGYVRGARSDNKRNQAKASITYKKESIKGAKAKVFTVVKYLHINKRRKRKRWKKIRVDWGFEKIGDQWKITDIVTNDNSLIDTYKEQFEKIISKKGFADLQKRLQKKVNELRKKRGLSVLTGPAAKKDAKKAVKKATK